MSNLLDGEVLEVLSELDSFFIQQRVRMVEALTSGCIEQANIYDVFDKDNKRIMIIKEESDGCSRCCCAPDHSIMVKFYLVGKDAPELKPGQKVDWSYEPTSPPFMTFEREGCDCCFGDAPCPKPCIGCFACSESCRQTGALYSGDVTGTPGDTKGRDRAKLLGESIQPPGGGGFKPVMQIMERADPTDATGKTELFAASRGPCCTGGCSQFCFDSLFGIGKVSPDMENDSDKLHTANFGEYATITKLKPKTMGQAVREAFTDSDLFDVKFLQKEVTPQQKANVLAQLVHLDYMFFENDNDMCEPADGGGIKITIANCFIYGCICPCQIVLKNNGS